MYRPDYFKKLLLVLSFGPALVLSSCRNPEPNSPLPVGEYHSGVFIVNEGNFGAANGEISFFNRSTREHQNELFRRVNNRSLNGDVVQSLHIHDDQAFIVCNNSNKVEVVNSHTFESEGVINGLVLPRYMATHGTRGYVSEWVSFSENGRIAVVDLNTLSVLSTIPVGSLPEQVLLVANKLYVANSASNTLSVINPETNALESTITVRPGAAYLQADASGNIWVLCRGRYKSDYSGLEERGALIRFNPANPANQTVLEFSSEFSQPSNLIINATGTRLYYSYSGQVFEHDVNATQLSATPLINRSFYGIGLDPAENVFYGADAGNFTSEGQVIRYNLSTQAPIDSFPAGIGPNSFLFR